MANTKFYYKNKNAPKPNKPNHIGTCAIIKYDNKILFEKRRDSDRWALIGGALEIDESLVHCIIREIREETGLIVEENNLRFFKIYSDPSRIIEYPDGSVLRSITAAYILELDKPYQLTCSEESEELKIFNLDELRKLKIAETHRPIVHDYITA